MPRLQGFRVPRSQGSKVPGFQGSGVPRFQGSRVPGFQGSRVPGFQGCRVPESLSRGSKVPGFQGSRVPFRILKAASPREPAPALEIETQQALLLGITKMKIYTCIYVHLLAYVCVCVYMRTSTSTCDNFVDEISGISGQLPRFSKRTL